MPAISATPANAFAHYQAGTFRGQTDAALRIWNQVPPLWTLFYDPNMEMRATVWVQGRLLGQWICAYQAKPLVIPVNKGARVRVLVQRGQELKDIAFHVEYKHEHVFIEGNRAICPIPDPMPIARPNGLGCIRPIGSFHLRHLSGRVAVFQGEDAVEAVPA